MKRISIVLVMAIFALVATTVIVPEVETGRVAQKETACGGLLRGVLRGAARATGVQRRQERRESRGGLFGRAC